jgi:periplasmic divalent cation tolerance protein
MLPAMENPLLLVFCTFPTLEAAREISRTLVEERLAACVNLTTGVESIYRWEGKLESAQEALTIIKTTPDAYPRLEARLQILHPYDVPEIIALPVEKASRAYACWVGEAVA